ncbi:MULTISPECIES: CbiX/SirB N-terminal domain-containing protein [unclassified Ruegeria]|uniref:CbiX/SirB N-terminal domain-containing protein n=1 Tax=unclassified Ruegeria TaxID=2625375 RepID=UPI001488A93A|nr:MULTISPECIES: CbiX/SirB N-terminal domain-containing protein [unclassified Ruegeria]NOD34824.1 cobalamin biosynthesis protein CbiX [Ruegeria sp. HKCCD7296]NOE34630.1 cobalamin biosynthesis protein CbiX [Ruegeria sp. HKCCD7318]NOE41704.1 cobalamin biosynthesis protein CbiX [Ruegeria sp. HKCCD7319]
MSHAIIVAHGQPSEPDPAEAALAAFAAKVDALTSSVTVHSATLAKPGALEAQLDGLPENTVIYPLFMAKGWFVTSALPKRVGDHAARILDPLGIDPDLPTLTAQALHAKLRERNWKASTTDLVIAAHGSGRSRNPSAVANEFARQLGTQVAFQSIRVGFVEEPPSIAEAAHDASDQAICLPFFACTGGHVLEDVPDELARAKFNGTVMPVVGELAPIQHQIAKKVTEAFASV